MISSLRNIFRRNSSSVSRVSSSNISIQELFRYFQISSISFIFKDVSTRVDYSDLLRKKKREDSHSSFRKLVPKCEKTTCDKRLAKDFIKAIRNENDVAKQLETAKKVREMTIDKYLMVEYLLKLDLLDAINKKLLQSQSIELQHEGVWICANISIDNAEEILKSGVHDQLMKLMAKTGLSEGCLWAFANISSESKETRDALLQAGILFHITSLSFEQLPLRIHQQITSVLLNFAKFDGLSREVVIQLLAVINKYLESDDFEEIYNSLCAVTFLMSDGENINPIVCSGTIPVLVKTLSSKNVACEGMAANLLKRLAETIDETCLTEILTVMPSVLKNQRAKSTSDVLRFIKTIAESEDSELWKKIIENDELLLRVIELVKDGNIEVVESSMELLSEFVSRGGYEDIKRLVNKGLLESMCTILKQDLKPDIVKMTLEALFKMLDKAEGYLKYMQFLIEECEGKQSLEMLMLHYNQIIADISIDIVAKYFTDDEDDSFLFRPLSPVDISFISDLNPSDEFSF